MSEKTYRIEFSDGAIADFTEEAGRKLRDDLKDGDAGLTPDLAGYLRVVLGEFFTDDCEVTP